jgi:hypothetical protein
MRNLAFTSGLLFSVLSFNVACSSDKSASPGGPDGSTSTGGAASTGGAKGSGGSTSTTGGATGAGGAKTDAGADAGTSPCETYCADEGRLCTGLNVQFTTNEDCLATCATYATGTPGDSTGDTLACRMTHLGFITSAAYATTHCQHTGKTPTDFCIPPAKADAGSDSGSDAAK